MALDAPDHIPDESRSLLWLQIHTLLCRHSDSDSSSSPSRPLLTETPFESVEASLTSDFDWDAAVGEEAGHLPRPGRGKMPTLEQDQQVSMLQSNFRASLMLAGTELGGATLAVHPVDNILLLRRLGRSCHYVVLVR